MLILGVPSSSSPIKELYDPRAFFTHATLLHQSFLHCAIFPTAASRRSLGPCLSSSVADRPLKPATHRCLGKPLPYQLANGTQTPPSAHKAFKYTTYVMHCYPVLALLSKSCPRLKGRLSTRYSPVRHFNCSRKNFLVRLACVRHAASVRPEPGSNSQVIILCLN